MFEILSWLNINITQYYISKLFSGLIACRVSAFLEAGNLIANKQNGFRLNWFCLDPIFALCDLLRAERELKLETFCSIVDFQKAFDYVDHDFLLYKLWNIGIDGYMYKAVKAMYSRPVSCVVVGDQLTD